MKPFELRKEKRYLLARVGNLGQLAGVQRYRFSEGRAKGVEAVEVRTGSGLEFTVLPGRGMDISRLSFGGVPFSYLAKPGIVAPEYYEHDGISWLRNFFAGMLTTCGLTNVGVGGEYRDRMLGPVPQGLHGRISNTPAELVSVKEEWIENEFRMTVSGRMREAMLHAENLTLTREITASLGGKALHLSDTVENEGFLPRPLMLLYHINVGYPLLDEGSRFICNPRSTESNDETAAKAVADFRKVHAPVNAMPEKVYFHDLPCGKDGKTGVALVNDRLEAGLYIRFNKLQLPEFTQWKQLGEAEYVIGLEPGNCRPSGMAAQEKRGKLEILPPGGRKKVELEIGVLDGADEIRRFEEAVAQWN
jgi:hypothetical protein